MPAMIVILVSLLATASAGSLPRTMPFAEGPLAALPAMRAAIDECRAPAQVVERDGAAIVMIADDRSDRAFNCLSAWIARHLDSGFEKFGFVGSERR